MCWCLVTKSCLCLWLHGLQHAKLPSPSRLPEFAQTHVHLIRSLINQWLMHPITSSSIAPFFFCPQSFPPSGSFPLSQLFASGGQSIVASLSVFLMNIEGWFSLGLIGLISLLSKGLLRIFSGTTLKSIDSFVFSLLYGPSHIHPWQVENHSFDCVTFVSGMMSLIFSMLSRFVIPFLRRSKRFFISRLQSPSSVILEPKKIKHHCFCFHPIY